MIRLVVAAIFLIGTAAYAHAAECRNGQNFAGCAGGGSAGVYNKNTGAYHQGNTMGGYYRPPAGDYSSPGAHIEGRYGNEATKGLGGCSWVNGQRYCR
jgi:hypothetical protein